MRTEIQTKDRDNEDKRAITNSVCRYIMLILLENIPSLSNDHAYDVFIMIMMSPFSNHDYD